MSLECSRSILNTNENAINSTSDVGWLWVLRLYASRIIPLKLDYGEMLPVYLYPLLEKYSEGLTGDERKNNLKYFLESIEIELSRFEALRPKLRGVIVKNIERLSRKFGFNTIEREILALRVLYRMHDGFEGTLNNRPENRWLDSKLYHCIAIALKQPVEAVEKALANDGKLCSSGLISVESFMAENFGEKLNVMNGLVSSINRPVKTIDELLSFAAKKTSKAKLKISDYQHHADEVQLIHQYLSNAVKARMEGVNILLHGAPGVGKTELAKTLASSLKLKAYDVAIGTGADHEANKGKHPRFRSYILLQRMLSQSSNGLVIFDEIEDVMPRPGVFDKPGSNKKAWINMILENNDVPTIWIANHVWQIDPAFMRRFDIVLEIKTPPRSARRSMLKQAFHQLPVDARWLDKKSGEADLTPALMNKTLRVIRNLGDISTAKIQKQFDSQMEERRNAQGIVSSGAYLEPAEYKLELLNTGSDMQVLVSSLARSGRGRVLLYGPPGCGKTAFAQHLAITADIPLMLKRTSDLMSKWIGETEKNLRDMFREATQDNAVLLLDEADSFLQDRRSAERSWELTQVNELLTQMENFQGIFICATNFMEHLDQAAMRRFAIKLKFDYLKPEQVQNLFAYTLERLGGEQLNVLAQQKVQQRLTALRNLTPGDFTAVADGFSLLEKQPSFDDLLYELGKESELKNGGKKTSMGFVA